MILNTIQIKQQGDTRPIYTFDKSWAKSGGNLHGDNFLTDICSLGEISIDRSSTRVTNIDGVWELSSLDTDPDVLLYLWKHGQGKDFDFYITESEILFLYEFYRLNGFEFMIDDINSAAERIYRKNNHWRCTIS